MLGMQPSEFWKADPWSVADAYEGYLDDVVLRTTGKSRPRASNQPWTEEELDELDRMIREDEQRMAKKAGRA